MRMLSGKVVSTKMAKTIVVDVRTQKLHPLYKKILKKKKRYKAHNDSFEVKIGDFVRIKPVRPISKEKHYKLVEIIRRQSK